MGSREGLPGGGDTEISQAGKKWARWERSKRNTMGKGPEEKKTITSTTTQNYATSIISPIVWKQALRGKKGTNYSFSLLYCVLSTAPGT